MWCYFAENRGVRFLWVKRWRYVPVTYALVSYKEKWGSPRTVTRRGFVVVFREAKSVLRLMLIHMKTMATELLESVVGYIVGCEGP